MVHFAGSSPRLAALHAREPWESIGWGLGCSDSRRPGERARRCDGWTDAQCSRFTPFDSLGFGSVWFALWQRSFGLVSSGAGLFDSGLI